MELISIIIPVYNVKPYIKKCVDSVVNQTYKDIEIILVDDGSTDGSDEICDECARTDNRIKVIHKKNGGLSDARNAGIDIANGKYLAFIDSDDYICSHMIEKLYDALVSNCADLSLCDIRYVYENDNDNELDASVSSLKNQIWDEKIFWNEFYGNNHVICVVAWNKLYRKELFDDLRFDVGKIHEDEFIIHKVINRCVKIVCVDEKLYNYLQRDSSIMGQGYSIKRLDAIEALIDRSQYFVENKEQTFAEKTIKYAVSRLSFAYNNLNMKDKSTKCQYKNLYKMLRQSYTKVAKTSHSSVFLVGCLLFLFNFKLLFKLLSLKNKKVKSK